MQNTAATTATAQEAASQQLTQSPVANAFGVSSAVTIPARGGGAPARGGRGGCGSSFATRATLPPPIVSSSAASSPAAVVESALGGTGNRRGRTQRQWLTTAQHSAPSAVPPAGNAAAVGLINNESDAQSIDFGQNNVTRQNKSTFEVSTARGDAPSRGIPSRGGRGGSFRGGFRQNTTPADPLPASTESGDEPTPVDPAGKPSKQFRSATLSDIVADSGGLSNAFGQANEAILSNTSTTATSNGPPARGDSAFSGARGGRGVFDGLGARSAASSTPSPAAIAQTAATAEAIGKLNWES